MIVSSGSDSESDSESLNWSGAERSRDSRPSESVQKLLKVDSTHWQPEPETNLYHDF